MRVKSIKDLAPIHIAAMKWIEEHPPPRSQRTTTLDNGCPKKSIVRKLHDAEIIDSSEARTMELTLKGKMLMADLRRKGELDKIADRLKEPAPPVSPPGGSL